MHIFKIHTVYIFKNTCFSRISDKIQNSNNNNNNKRRKRNNSINKKYDLFDSQSIVSNVCTKICIKYYWRDIRPENIKVFCFANKYIIFNSKYYTECKLHSYVSKGIS